jgi:hypothetical protein
MAFEKDPTVLFKNEYKALLFEAQGKGIRLRRDSWVSVMYAEALTSTTSSVILQSTDRHGIVGQKPPDFQLSL